MMSVASRCSSTPRTTAPRAGTKAMGARPRPDTPLSLVLPLATAADALKRGTLCRHLAWATGLAFHSSRRLGPDDLAPGLGLVVALSNARGIGCSHLDRVCACRHDGDGFRARSPQPTGLRQCGPLRRIIRGDHRIVAG